MRLIDTHSHLFLEEFSEDFPQVIERARAAGVYLCPILTVRLLKQCCQPVAFIKDTVFL